jgi:GT2 family glycosyltransferase
MKVEAIVVDNASTDGSPQMVRKIKPQIKNLKLRLIENRQNRGFAGGHNLGLKLAEGKYILFLNSDTELYPTALKQAVDFMESDPKIGAMTPKTMLFSGGMDPDCHRGFPTPWASLTYFCGLERIFPKSRLFGQYHKFYVDLSKPHEIDAGFGTFMIVRLQVVREVGNWDESYFFYGEDLDYFYRIRKAGWKVMFYPKPLLLHHKGGSSGLRKESKKVTSADKETRIRTAKASIKAMEIFYRKFYQGRYPAWITFLVLTGIKVKGFCRLLIHLVKP